MTRFGYTLMTEQSGPRELVGYAQHADRLGFDFAVSSDHYFPWLDAQGHAPYAWSVLGAVAQATERLELMTYVTCPTIRYHPAVVAQKAATMALLSEGRFTLNVGAGENLNEHVVGERWPAVGERHDMLEEALEIIHRLFDGERVTYEGAHFRVDSARLWDLPDTRVPIGVAVSGGQSVSRFSGLADHLVAVEPDADLVRRWDEARAGLGSLEVVGPSRKIGQVPISWGPDRDEAVARAHDEFRWFGGGWKVNADLPTTEAFEAASQFVRPEDVAASIPCGPDLDAVVEAVAAYWEAGFTDVAVVQVGDALQQQFLDEAAGPLLERLRAAAPAD
ncbi:TIGR03557 family F420-dependent LLM class oxidoreductase [Cellulomonas wangsupingiae]|uniref:TIGR03557 family F420-dependent LLM class oxidoreductase n=1 Tax=Cellulomonas wangsupingiae TaxID=2968085 RepID=A0ABY5K5Z2_9CELL|nr:TIGR03557 family F420-dependent LLM class oxidoreductase [Cellulomonas wangsupingiae]MCC2336105.1 TIGR03557 family F420-dependent LLM class oxidoreductase [Cellulomonas wangsupingiae]MCM0639583.1 TIGR03557 family F420-dependent LLM class oxidoreductase [Cellulomonas wangsupingiae]UUI64826.1 TIGR03557 family F420-dependent LLM class oxidoreductase [Cellulomonas wangsupingiae]